MKFQRKNVLITGGTRGIGKGLALAFLREGARVIATYKSNEQAANELQSESERGEDQLWIARCDGRQKNELDALAKSIEDKWDGIDILINNSGIKKDGLLAMMSLADWDDVIDSNLKSTFLTCQAFLPHMLAKRGGRIINISSLSGHIGLKGQCNYAASKAGQMALTKSLSKEVAKKKITVNCLVPGFIETEMTQDLDPEMKKLYTKDIPMKRFGTIAEVTSAALFLASDEASYITGSEIVITGGLS